MVRRPGLLALLTLLALLEAPAVAGAHAFLVRSSPRAGERLAGGPPALTLEFSDTIVPGSPEVSVRTPDGRPLEIGPVHGDSATTLRTGLPPDLRGVYVVSW
ncbi:MAG: copper resistance CopC family protein, partial [Candidatus Rokuibacteriota bacterium]